MDTFCMPMGQARDGSLRDTAILILGKIRAGTPDLGSIGQAMGLDPWGGLFF